MLPSDETEIKILCWLFCRQFISFFNKSLRTICQSMRQFYSSVRMVCVSIKKKLASDWTRAPLHSNGLCLRSKKISIRSNSLPIHSQKISIRSNCFPICSNNLLILPFINRSLSVHFSQLNSFCYRLVSVLPFTVSNN